MEKNLGDIRKLLKYEFKLGHNAKEAVTNINRANGGWNSDLFYSYKVVLEVPQRRFGN